jgi:hypothetical protein
MKNPNPVTFGFVMDPQSSRSCSREANVIIVFIIKSSLLIAKSSLSYVGLQTTANWLHSVINAKLN